MPVDDRVKRIEDSLVHISDGESLSVSPWGPDGLRVRVTAGGAVLDTPWALSEQIPPSDPSIVINSSEASIRNGKISARLTDIRTQTGYLEFHRHPEVGQGTCILREQDYVVGAHNPGTRVLSPRGDGLCYAEAHFAPREGERLYGMGLNATGRVNLKGCVIDLYQRHVKHVVPFVVSSEGYGFLWNNPALGRVEFGHNRTRWISRGCKQIDYYITAGDSYAEIMEHYADVTGHAPMLPYWASGFWQCKNRYRTQEEFLRAAREFKRRGLPLSVLVIDYRHWQHWGDWKLDPEFWPDPAAMIDELDAMGARIMISPWVLVEEASENFLEFHRSGLFVTSLDGAEAWYPASPPSASPHPADRPRGRTLQYDPTHPDAGAFIWERWKRNYFDLGIRTFWLDPCDDLNSIDDYDKVRYHIGPAIETHCYYPVAHQKNIYDGLVSAGEDEVVTICRSSWAGSQRYGASPAAHDIESSFRHLREYMMAGLNLAMAGIPWGAAEIGGFVTPADQDDEFRELVVRWFQYGVFTPIFRTHGYRENNEPWNIGGDTFPHIRAALMLRERLRPYIMEQMSLAAARGIPPMRPLFFDFDADPNVAEVEDQFLFGPDILVAPITEYKARDRSVYLPAGSDWTDALTGKTTKGGTTVTADAPVEHIPVFLRGRNDELRGLFLGLYDL